MSSIPDLPFERNPQPMEIPVGDEAIAAAGALVVAIGAPTPFGVMPGLMFRFGVVGGGMYAPVVLVPDSPQKLREFAELVHRAVEAAIEATAGDRP